MTEPDFDIPEGAEFIGRDGKHYYRLDGEWVTVTDITPHVAGALVLVVLLVGLAISYI